LSFSPLKTSALLFLALLSLALTLAIFAGRFEVQPAPEKDSPAASGSAGSRIISGLEIHDKYTGQVYKGTVDLGPALARIAAGERFPHIRDGGVYGNRSRALPGRPHGYYKEYVVPTPGFRGPGPQRLVIGRGGEIYYTPDHYESFIEIKP